MPRGIGRRGIQGPTAGRHAARVRVGPYGDFLLELAALVSRHGVTISGEMRVESTREIAPLREWIDLAPDRVLALLADVQSRAAASDAARRTLARCRARLASTRGAG